MSTPTAIAYEKRRSSTKQLVEKHRFAKEVRRKYEKELNRKGRLCGTMWGYDPMAGRLPEVQNAATSDHHVHGCYIFRGSGDDSDEYGVDEVDTLGRRTGRQWLEGTKWGIECGGPGKEPPFEDKGRRTRTASTSQVLGTGDERGKQARVQGSPLKYSDD